MKPKKRVVGFTLIELMITVAIVGILAAIAYPSYRQSIIKSNRTDAKISLTRTAGELEKCFTLNGVYNSTIGNCGTLKTSLEGAGSSSDQGKYVITSNGALGNNSFSLIATPQAAQANDTECANFTLTDANIRNITGTGSSVTCWR